VGGLLDSLHSALALGPVAQDHLLQARQMQTLSFTVHIPLVCFDIGLIKYVREHEAEEQAA
jgi:hypothetical protein